MGALNNETFKLCRNYLGLSQKSFAQKLGVSQALVSNIEKSTKPLTSDIVDKLKREFGETFFSQKMYDPNLAILYRASNSVAKKFTNLFESRLQLISNNISSLLEYLEIPTNKIPQWDLRSFNGNVENLAKEARKYFKLGALPITDLVGLLEKNGVIIFFYEYDFITSQNKTFDGVSFYVEGVPVILINNRIQNARKMFTISHELLHLIAHNNSKFFISKERDIEKEANLFASEFIAPKSLLINSFHNLTLQKLFELKNYWRLSIGALLYKAKESSLSADQYRRWVTRLAKFRKSEPNDFELNKPKLLKLMFETLETEMGSKENFYAELGLSEEIFKELYSTLITDRRAKMKVVI